MKDRVSRRILKLAPLALALFLALFLIGCAADQQELNPFFPGGNETPEAGGNVDNISYWVGDGIAGRPSIKIDLEAQRASFYRDQQIVGVSIVSTGREGHDTPPGKYHVSDKDKDHASSIYGDYVDESGQVIVPNVQNKKDPRPPGTVFRGAAMPYFLRIHGSIGMHAGYLPGYPASHGCIRLPEPMAIKFFENAPIGTSVEIR